MPADTMFCPIAKWVFPLVVVILRAPFSTVGFSPHDTMLHPFSPSSKSPFTNNENALGLPVGDDVGEELGAALGLVVGDIEGDPLGLLDGLALGLPLGLPVGETLGARDGDAVGLMAHFSAESPVVISHDWGAMVAWHCALFRPDLFAGVMAMSVPYMPRGPLSLIDMLKAVFGDSFNYILYFQEPGVAEAELDIDPRAMLHRSMWGVSGDRPEEMEAPDPTTQTRLLEGGGLPDGLPPWAPPECSQRKPSNHNSRNSSKLHFFAYTKLTQYKLTTKL